MDRKERINHITEVLKNCEGVGSKGFVRSAREGDMDVFYVNGSFVAKILTALRDDKDLKYGMLIDVFGIDFLGSGRKHRFEVVYNLLSLKYNNRITVKVMLDEGQSVESAVSVFSTAGWFEREAFDMYGIEFDGHEDLRRILTDYDFEGHPLRKDFPLTGYKEVRYDKEKGGVIYEDVKLDQEYRDFDFSSPWQGEQYMSSVSKKI